MKLLAYILAEWDAFVGALEKLVGYHKATGTLPTIPDPPATGATGATGTSPTIPAVTLPVGVVLVDAVNGLFSVDPSLGNPDTAGQTFCPEAAANFFAPHSQAAFTVQQNNSEAVGAENNGLGMHVGVRPMVATGDPLVFVSAPMIIGATMDRVPWIPKAWTITGATWPLFLDHVLNHWKLPTVADPNAHGHVPGA